MGGTYESDEGDTTRSCHGAFLGSSIRATVDAMSPIPATPAREYADVAVKMDGDWVESSTAVASQWSQEKQLLGA